MSTKKEPTTKEMALTENKPAETAKERSGTSRLRSRLYFRGPLIQLAVVVTGILITFQGSAWIDKSRQRSQARDILTMMSTELRENLDRLKNIERTGKRELAGMTFVARHMHDIRKAPRDSIDMYLGILGAGPEFSYSSNALQVLKASTSAVNVMDKELLRKIFLCYDELDRFITSMNYYFLQKFDVVGQFYFSLDMNTVEKMRSGEDPYLFVEKYIRNVPTRNHVLNVGDNFAYRISEAEHLRGVFEETMEDIDNYISKRKTRKESFVEDAAGATDDGAGLESADQAEEQEEINGNV